jgi:DNA-binding NarL/FixJ family response regulator
MHEAEARLVVERDRTAARELLSAARTTALALRARPLVERIERIAALGRIDLEEPAPDAPSDGPTDGAPDPFGLTARERQVLALIALGRTNRDIGEALFITDKTASSHVTHILDKLGVASRVEAALLAERRGLVDARVDTGPPSEAEPG